MSITREQVADLRPGDVVDLVTRERITVAQVVDGEAYPYIGDGSAPELLSLTVISRAPRPLYVNHDRTEPVAGDVVRDADGGDGRVWIVDASGDCWTPHAGTVYMKGATLDRLGITLPDRLRLLVDGETGQVVP